MRRFARDFFTPGAPLTFIGDGELGGKARGLAAIHKTVANLDRHEFADVEVTIPFLTVITSEFFDAYMARNRLFDVIAEEPPDERVAHAFLKGELPATLVGDLRALAAQVRTPLAVRSSSLLEDATDHPFAGVYATKMIPNNQLDADTRFRKLVEAVKLVWASTFFGEARNYRAVAGVADDAEKMAVIVQEIVGVRHGERFYPDVSGVARSVNYYPCGNARPEDGVAELALGLGKWVVDGEPAWSYSPAWPKAPPPYNSLGDLMKVTQTAFWAVNLGQAPYDPARETEYMVRAALADAEGDDTLRLVASTYDPHANRLVAGAGAKGPRVLNFAPLLQHGLVPLNAAVRGLLVACADAMGAPVEIEFATTISAAGTARLGFLQVRPMVAPGETVAVGDAEMTGANVLVASTSALGNGVFSTVADVVYVRPERFEPQLTPQVAREVEGINRKLVHEGRPYLLLGFGRWGSSDSWGGVPVNWAQISGARAIVEAQLATMRMELSQGSHFFHNLTAFRVPYLSVPHGAPTGVDWRWLDSRPAASETEVLRHIRLATPLSIRVDGRTGRGVITHD